MRLLYCGIGFLIAIGAPLCQAFLGAPLNALTTSRTNKQFVLPQSTISLKAVKTNTFLSESWKIPFTSLLLSAQLASPSHAIDSVFNHDYSDPLHPLCNRRIEVLDDGKSFHYTGTAVGPKDDPVLRGCSKEEIRKYKLRRGEFYGEVLPGNKISAGDGIHEGVS
jgi:hypothetical protein